MNKKEKGYLKGCPGTCSYSSMDRTTGYGPADSGSSPDMSAMIPESKG